MRKTRLLLRLGIAALIAFVFFSGRFLIIDQPARSDLIVVLAGETERRPQRALELLAQGYASQVLLDVPAGTTIYSWTQQDLAQKYINGLPQAQAMKICAIDGLSTKEEAINVGNCLRAYSAHKILLVTSDYHTRRALSTFSRELPNYQFSVAAACDPREFGPQWWQHRQWAKTNLLEFSKLLWWELVERWY
ncbi:MAG TPA: YdcF family protein [Terriglobales bacterium]|nr:YdcF family protein [Terriglobales bacterium]